MYPQIEKSVLEFSLSHSHTHTYTRSPSFAHRLHHFCECKFYETNPYSIFKLLSSSFLFTFHSPPSAQKLGFIFNSYEFLCLFDIVIEKKKNEDAQDLIQIQKIYVTVENATIQCGKVECRVKISIFINKFVVKLFSLK